jgi:hypothetical protein
MKKYVFALLLIGTFATYAIFVQQSALTSAPKTVAVGKMLDASPAPVVITTSSTGTSLQASSTIDFVVVTSSQPYFPPTTAPDASST